MLTTMSTDKALFDALTFPRRLSSIFISVAILALFLIIASFVLVTYPISSGFYLLDRFGLRTSIIAVKPQTRIGGGGGGVDINWSNGTMTVISSTFNSSEGRNDTRSPTGKNGDANHREISYPSVGSSPNASERVSKLGNSTSPATDLPPVSYDDFNKVKAGTCDLYRGKWISDPAGPLYTNNSCPIITQMQNCQGNGRPDKEYENWRWKPDECELPRFDPRKFLELMRGKTLAFVGDSVSRNQMESLLCILWQVETPKNRGNKRMHRWYFRSTSTMIVRIWSSWLVHQTDEAVDFAPKGVVKLHLDAPDDNFMELLPSFDVVILSSGHWFAKQSVYVLDNKIVGGQLWWPDKHLKMQTNNIDAFGVSVETIISAIASHPNYTGLTIVRSYSPDHYEGGAWNTGGSCTGKTRPATKLVPNGFTDVMHEKQLEGFNRALKKTRKTGPKPKFMDITNVFGYRHDGHPGPYRSTDPNKKTKPGPNGQPPPQDCLHWCMPGPVDTWNELMMEIIRREFEGKSKVEV